MKIIVAGVVSLAYYGRLLGPMYFEAGADLERSSPSLAGAATVAAAAGVAFLSFGAELLRPFSWARLTNYSPEGSALDIVAPSGHFTNRCLGEIVTADLSGPAGCNDGPNGDIDYSSTFSGTSAAAPQVSATAALVYSVDRGLSMSQTRFRILNGADPWGAATKYGVG